MASMIDEIRHYALETIPSIYDEEALTALQLCGRVASKLNEVIRAFQGLSRGTDTTLEEFETQTIPTEVKNQIQTHINNGDFDQAINLYCGDLVARLNSILTGHSADKDAELVDARMDHRQFTWGSLGQMLRFWLNELENNLECVITWQTKPVPLDMILGYVNTSGEFVKENLATHKCATVEVIPGERYRVKTSYGYSMPSFVVQDKDHNPIMYGLTNDGGTVHCNYNEVVTMPAGARYLIINSMNGYYAGLQLVVGVNSNALDGDYITNALAGVLAGPVVESAVVGKKMLTAHALKNGEVIALNNGDTSHRVVRYNVREGKAYNIKTAVSFGCNPYVFYNRAGSIIDKLVVGPEDTTQEYNVKVRAPIGAVEMLVYFTGNYEAVVTVDSGCQVEVPAVAGSGYPDWSHLKWYILGDSLTDPAGGVHTDKFYYEYVAEKTGIQTIVDGIGGTGFYAGMSDSRSFADRVKNIPADVDIVTIFGSGNDIRHGYDNYNPYMTDALRTLYQTRPELRVIVVPPSPWKGYQKRGDEWKTYCDRLELLALNYSHRYVDDMFKCPPFDPNMDTHLQAFFSKDAEGVHPDENGHEALAPYFYNALLKELAFK